MTLPQMEDESVLSELLSLFGTVQSSGFPIMRDGRHKYESCYSVTSGPP